MFIICIYIRFLIVFKTPQLTNNICYAIHSWHGWSQFNLLLISTVLLNLIRLFLVHILSNKVNLLALFTPQDDTHIKLISLLIQHYETHRLKLHLFRCDWRWCFVDQNLYQSRVSTVYKLSFDCFWYNPYHGKKVSVHY